ncbi:glycosyltransferase family 2 protein [Flexivirga lutea]
MTDGDDREVAVTVIVPTYRSGPGLQRVFDSVDEVTLPGGLEVIFVDDGSGDDTVQRLHDFARDRPHVRVIELENSGWPSRPRNVALEQARGEYVLFMDHDDSLFPNALRRAYEFACEQDADVVSPKESKTNDAWWSLQDADFGNTPDIRLAGGVRRMIPMVPHKLYRRRMLLEHNIRFPEGRRFLWEDWYVNVSSYRYGKVAALVDTAMYVWHASDTQTTHTFDPYRQDYWDRLEDLFEHIRETLPGPQFDDDRNTLIRHNLGLRVIQQSARQLAARARKDPAASSRLTGEESMILKRAAQALKRYGEPGVLANFTPVQSAQARLLRLRRPGLIRSFELAIECLSATVMATEVGWRNGALHLELETRWTTSDPDKASFVPESGGGGHLDLGWSLNTLVPRGLLSTGQAPEPTEIALRDRSGKVSWPVASELLGPTTMTETGFSYRTRAVVDPATAAAGAPVPDAVLDLRVRSLWLGLRSYGGIETRCPPAAMLTGRRQGTAYRNTKGMLSLDLSGTLRVPAIDAAPQEGPIGPVSDFRARLTKVALHEPQPLSVELAAIPLETDVSDLPADERQERLRGLAAHGRLSTRIVVEDGSAWLTGSGDLAAGYYLLWADRGNKWERTRYAMSVAEDGTAHLDVR